MVFEGVRKGSRRRRRLLSARALLVGLLTTAGLSMGTDQLLGVLEDYSSGGEPDRDAGSYLLALAFRGLFSILGSWLAARLSPRNPMRHAMALGATMFILSIAAAMAAAMAIDARPRWYPQALALIALPAAWVGGALYVTWLKPAMTVSASPPSASRRHGSLPDPVLVSARHGTRAPLLHLETKT